MQHLVGAVYSCGWALNPLQNCNVQLFNLWTDHNRLAAYGVCIHACLVMCIHRFFQQGALWNFMKVCLLTALISFLRPENREWCDYLHASCVLECVGCAGLQTVAQWMVLGAVSGEMISCKYCAPPPSSTSCILHLVTLPNITTFLRMVDTETLDHR